MEYQQYKANSDHIPNLKRRVQDEDLRYYLIGLATALTLYTRRLQGDYDPSMFKERAKEARDLSGMLRETIRDLNGALGPEKAIQNLEKHLEDTKNKIKIEEDSALKKISDNKAYLTDFGGKIERGLQAGGYIARCFIVKEGMKASLEFIEKQNWSEEDKRKERARIEDQKNSKIFDREGEIIRDAMIFRVR